MSHIVDAFEHLVIAIFCHLSYAETYMEQNYTFQLRPYGLSVQNELMKQIFQYIRNNTTGSFRQK